MATGVTEQALAISLSAWFAMTGWFVGSLALLENWKSAARLWAVGCGSLLLHLAIAFHFAHGWSHAAAFEHTRRAGGFGEGLYANYAFAALWFTDAAWLGTFAASYRRRPRWLTFAIHGFLSFMVFNAMVVFGTWPARGLFFAFVFFATRRISFPSSSRLPESSITR